MRKFLTVLSILAFLFIINLLFFQKDNAHAAQLQTNQQVTQVHENEASPLDGLKTFFAFTGFANVTAGNVVMILAGLLFIFIAIKYEYEPMLLVPIGVGMLLGNIPIAEALNLQKSFGGNGDVLSALYAGVTKGIYPSLIFLGIGAMTDFSTIISNPKLLLLGIAAQIGIFTSFFIGLACGFHPAEAASIGIVGSADGPTSIFLASKLANGINILSDGTVVKNLIAPVAITSYLLMALVPVIQPAIMKLLTSKNERLIKMKVPRAVSRREKVIFPVIALLFTCFIAPAALPLLGMLFFGNLLKESGVTKRLAETARTSLVDIVTILLGVTIGASAQAYIFLTKDTALIFVIGTLSFVIATAGGILFAKLMNLFLRGEGKINPLLGAAGVSAISGSARIVHAVGLKEDPKNHLLAHAMAPNIAGLIGSAIAAGILIGYLL